MALVAACGESEAADGGATRDAGRDAGVRDAGARDGGLDAGRDGGPDDPVWRRLAVLNDRCFIERALRPEALPAPTWEPCPEQPIGCMQAVPQGLAAAGHEPAWFDAARGHGYYTRSTDDALSRQVLALLSTEGRVVAAWRTPPFRADAGYNCDVHLGLGDGWGALYAKFFTSRDPDSNLEWLYYTPIEELGDLAAPAVVVPAPAFQPQRVFVSSELVVLSTSWGDIAGIDARDGRSGVLTGGLEGLPGGRQLSLVGAEAFWIDWADLGRAAHGTLGEPAAIFVRADPGNVRFLQTDGIEIAWQQGYRGSDPDGDYERLELWAAPYRRDLAALEPRLVRTMEPPRDPMAYGGGWFVTFTREHTHAPGRLDVYRTSDGSLRQIARVGVSSGPLYVTDHEILVQADRQLLRIDPHTLPVVAE